MDEKKRVEEGVALCDCGKRHVLGLERWRNLAVVELLEVNLLEEGVLHDLVAIALEKVVEEEGALCLSWKEIMFLSWRKEMFELEGNELKGMAANLAAAKARLRVLDQEPLQQVLGARA